jgi:hypothetical protein
MKTFIAAALLAASTLAHASGVIWRCESGYQDHPCSEGQRLKVDPDTNLIAAETWRPAPEAEPATGPSIHVIRRPPPAKFEGPSSSQPRPAYTPSRMNVHTVRP